MNFRTEMKARTWVVSIALALAPSAVPSSASEALPRGWDSTLQKAIGLARSGKPEKARDRLGVLLERMAETSDRGAKSERLLAIALVQSALLELELGAAEEARWYWQLALNVDPSVREPVAGLGERAKALLEWDLPPLDSCTRGFGEPLPVCAAGCQPPRPLKVAGMGHVARMPRPGVAGTPARVDVRVVVEEDGSVNAPRIRSASSVALAYATLMGLREWRYEPAIIEGRPAAVCFPVMMNFR
jgi:hypothetical protein